MFTSASKSFLYLLNIPGPTASPNNSNADRAFIVKCLNTVSTSPFAFSEINISLTCLVLKRIRFFSSVDTNIADVPKDIKSWYSSWISC